MSEPGVSQTARPLSVVMTEQRTHIHQTSSPLNEWKESKQCYNIAQQQENRVNVHFTDLHLRATIPTMKHVPFNHLFTS